MKEKRPITRTWLIQLRGNQSQAAIARLCGITQQYYCNIEQGTRRPSVQLAKTIGKTLGFDWQLFYQEEYNTLSSSCK